MNKETRHGFINLLILISVLLWIYAILLGIKNLFGYIFQNPKMLVLIVIFFLLFVVLCRKGIACLIKESKMLKKEKENKKELEALGKTFETARKLRFENAPKHLTDKQMNALTCFLKSLDIEASKNSVFIERPEFTNEELYTIIFINKESFEVIGTSVSGKTVTLEVRRNNGKAEVLNKDDLYILKPTATIEPVKKSHKQTKKINALRKERKLKAEAKANGLVYKNGKLYQPPNYTFLANEWVSQNIGLINKIIIDNDTPTSLVIKGLILADSLPDDKNTWKHIGQNLIDTDNIDMFAVQKNGLQIIINK